jgi:MarR family 2-MHQ and catechol resistance regulon transcriptional repressor
MNPTPTSALEVLLHKGPLPVNTIGPKVWLTPGSISVAVDRLEKKALVKRKNTDDRRVRLVKLHAKGRAFIIKTFREHATAMEEAAGVLSQEEPAPPYCSTQRDSFHRFRKR